MPQIELAAELVPERVPQVELAPELVPFVCVVNNGVDSYFNFFP